MVVEITSSNGRCDENRISVIAAVIEDRELRMGGRVGNVSGRMTLRSGYCVWRFGGIHGA